jgi:hypothetical protein
MKSVISFQKLERKFNNFPKKQWGLTSRTMFRSRREFKTRFITAIKRKYCHPLARLFIMINNKPCADGLPNPFILKIDLTSSRIPTKKN